MQISRKEIYELLLEIKNPVLYNWTLQIIDSLGDSFYKSPGSSSRHHCWTNGLALHSYSLTKLACKIADHYIAMGVKLNRDVVIAGCLLQDIGKIECYEVTPEANFIKLPDGETIVDWKYKATFEDSHFHHIPIGFQYVRRWAEKLNCENDINVKHATHVLIAHHGRKEWSSNREPQSIEALIGHHADFIDSCVFATEETQKLKLGGKTY